LRIGEAKLVKKAWVNVAEERCPNLADLTQRLGLLGQQLLEENHKDTKAQRKDGILRHLSPFVAWCLGGSVFGGLLVFVFRGSTAELLLEGTGEIGLVGEAELVGYLGYCSGILFQ